jgi:hypothetical protein
MVSAVFAFLKKAAEPLTQLQARPQQSRFHRGDAEAQGLGCLLG